MSSDTFSARRLHPAAVPIVALRALREAALPLLVVAAVSVAGGGLDSGDLGRTLPLAVIAAGLAGVAGAVTWASTTINLSADALSMRQGIFSVNETTIPLERVQALDELVGPLHRLFGVVRLDVQTAGGAAGGEISLAAVDPAVVETLRRAIAQRRGEEALQPPQAGPVRRLGRRALAVAALTSGRLAVLLPVVAFLPQAFDELFLADSGTDAGALLGLAPDTPAQWLVVGAVVVAAAWLLSALGVVIAFAGFEVERTGDRLVIHRGLFQRRAATVPVARVHAIRIVEGVLRQPFGLATVRVEVAGYAKEEPAAQTLFPLLRGDEVGALLGAMLPELAGELGPLRPAPRRALRRYVLPRAITALLLGAAGVVLFLSPIPLALVIPGIVAGVLAHRAAGCQVRDGRVAVRFRRLARTTLIGPARLTQDRSVRQSPFQRRAGLADFEITLGAGGRGRVRHLEAAEAWDAFAAAGSS